MRAWSTPSAATNPAVVSVSPVWTARRWWKVLITA